MTLSPKKGFTLIEVLITIAAIAVLSTVVILTLNPQELLRRARDSRRIYDLSTLKTAISIYIADTKNPSLVGFFGYDACYLSTVSGTGTTAPKCGVFASAGATMNVSVGQAFYRKIDSSGWIPVDFTQISTGAPFSQLPIDPLNNASYYYAYAATLTNYGFEINAFMESAKYGAGGNADVVSNSKDGGDNDSVYEAGTNLTL